MYEIVVKEFVKDKDDPKLDLVYEKSFAISDLANIVINGWFGKETFIDRNSHAPGDFVLRKDTKNVGN